MKYHLFFFFLFSLAHAQNYIQETFLHDGLQREYLIYVPNSYNISKTCPLVLNLHGYGSNANQQSIYADFRTLAERDTFIIVCPNGTNDLSGSRHWNADNGTIVDDIGFLSNLIDYLLSQYNIDASKVYSTGMSNGGFMSYKLACDLSNKIAKIASVTGSMNLVQYNNCFPGTDIPIMQIHGTSDLTVPYNGSTFSVSINDLIAFWINNNQCNTTAEIYNFPNTNTSDNSSASRYIYYKGTEESVILIKVEGGGHTWPGSIDVPAFGNTCKDFNASEEIWEFFKGKVDTNTSTKTQEFFNTNLSCLESKNEIVLEAKNGIKIYNISTYNILGKKLTQIQGNKLSKALLANGMYFLVAETNKGLYKKSFIK